MTVHLWNRLAAAKQKLSPIRSNYAVVYQTPDMPTCVVMHPDPNWMAAALAGGILPPIGAYLEDQEKQGGDRKAHPYAEPIGPMTEEQAIEYLIMKDVPRAVWDQPHGSNTRTMIIVKRSDIPTDRTFRNAWQLSQD